MSETLPSLTANGQKLIDRLLTLPQGWVTAAMLAESIGVSRRTVLRELPSVEQWIAAAGYHFVRSPGQGLLLDEPPARREQMRARLNGSTVYALSRIHISTLMSMSPRCRRSSISPTRPDAT